MKRQFIRVDVGVLVAVALGTALLPLRSCLSIASSALERDRHPGAARAPGLLNADCTPVLETFVRLDINKRASLGLAIAKAFIEADAGTIWVDDHEDGSRFIFTLQFASSDRASL